MMLQCRLRQRVTSSCWAWRQQQHQGTSAGAGACVLCWLLGFVGIELVQLGDAAVLQTARCPDDAV
jgi:hypothetical protein